MSDRIVIAGMVFRARHGLHPDEKMHAQRFEVDVELELPLVGPGSSDDLADTIDYSVVYATVRQLVETTTHDLIERLAETIADALLATHRRAAAVTVRVRKPEVRLGGPLAYAGVEIRRVRTGGADRPA